MDNHRYFSALNGGVTHQALDAAENRAEGIYAAYDKLVQMPNVQPPVAVTYEGYLLQVFMWMQDDAPKAFLLGRTALHSQNRKNATPPHIIIEEYVASVREHLKDVSVELLQRETAQQIIISGSQGDMNNSGFAADLEKFMNYTMGSWIHPNTAVEIADFARLNNWSITPQQPEKATLTAQGKTSYPVARRVFTNWVIRLPPYRPAHKNDYVPPECVALSAQELKKMTSDMPFEDFRCDHGRLKHRLFRLPTIDVTPR